MKNNNFILRLIVIFAVSFMIPVQAKNQTLQNIRSNNSIKVGGRIQTDLAIYTDNNTGFNNSTEIRRARLFIKGNLGKTWGYKVQYDFTDDGINGVRDAYLDYKGFENTTIRVGHFREPFSLQNMTSSKYVLFMERALPQVFAEGHNPGLQLSHSGNNWSTAVGLYGDKLGGSGGGVDAGWGVSTRTSYAPIYEKHQILHLGGSIAYRASNSKNTLRFRERPESHLTNIRLVDTGIFNADTYTKIASEIAFIQGPLHMQWEYHHININRDIASNTKLNFSGFYMEVAWFLTGESMHYKISNGSFARVIPTSSVAKGGLGAWQVATRFSHLDLTDKEITGGAEDNFTIGLNWYATPKIRCSANYINVLNVKGGSRDGDEPKIFQLRAQFEF